MPKPRVMPWTAGKPSATAATPASAPEATGTSVSARAGSERYTVSSSTATSRAASAERRMTWPLIRAREATANTGGPVMRSVTLGRAAAGIAPRLEANARRTVSQAACCASVSEPAARTCAMSSACRPSGELHTPSAARGSRPARNVSRMPSISPVGSRVNSGFRSVPAGEARRSSESVIAARRPAALKRSGVTLSLSWYRCAKRNSRSRSRPAASPLLTATNAGSARSRRASSADTWERSAPLPPSMARSRRRAAGPERSCSMRSCWVAVGLRGRKADRSAV